MLDEHECSVEFSVVPTSPLSYEEIELVYIQLTKGAQGIIVHFDSTFMSFKATVKPTSPEVQSSSLL